MTEVEEIAESILRDIKQSRAPLPASAGGAVQIVRERMPDETPAVVFGVGDALYWLVLRELKVVGIRHAHGTEELTMGDGSVWRHSCSGSAPTRLDTGDKQ